MKKFYTIIIFFLFTFNSNAHVGHYNNFKKIELEILRNNEVIGYNNYSFSRKDNETTVNNKYKFTVKLLGATIFEVEGFGEEKYLGDNLISFKSKTRQNKKEKFVNLIGNWWSHKLLQAESQISPISGSIKEQLVTFIGKEKITINGKEFDTDHFKLTSKDMALPEDKRLNFDIWLDKKTSVIVKVTYERMGSWEYRIKNIE